MSRLKILREKKNLTQEELSEKSGISVRTIQRIESGITPKGHTLKALSKTLEISEVELTGKTEENRVVEKPEELIDKSQTEMGIDFQKIKLINLSSILFVLLPPLNILVPLLLFYALKQKNHVTRQIISLQIIWTILAPIIFMLGILLKPGRSFTIVILILIVLSNVFLILRNLSEIDRNKRLRYKLNFSII